MLTAGAFAAAGCACPDVGLAAADPPGAMRIPRVVPIVEVGVSDLTI